ncbi:MAG: SDR family oxidoreductase [Bryobacter sp.]|jgi:NAD(P)-dependent dehydrogenase (short-subunit alcohol dehydrogenase family)|nr:SDR family oxidoreductase [Bryobacter sp. CoA8 C33]
MRFSGKTAIVTGGASGIGKATAELLASEGAQVLVWDLQGELPSVDLTDENSIRKALIPVERVDILVYSAGVQTYGTAVSTPDEVWQRTLEVNLNGAFRVCRAVLPKMPPGGAITLVGSVQSVAAVANSCAYVTSKHALLGLTRSIALDYAAAGIRCNCLCPGAIDTPMLRWSASLTPDPEATLAACARVHPLNRLGKADEIARAAAFLSSDDASFITGTAFMADGGAMVPVGGAAFQDSGTAQAGKGNQ